MYVDDGLMVLWETGKCRKGLTFTGSVFLIMQRKQAARDL